METIKTVIHAYRYDTRDKAQAASYAELKAKLRAQGLTCFETWGGSGHYAFVADIDGQTVSLETRHLFNNQWNTAPIPGKSDKGLRVFDWAQDYPVNIPKYIKRGHYLEQTAEMADVRRNTAACGYCGKQEPMQKGYTFCPHCIDSAYLKPEDLHLTRMLPIAHECRRAPLTDGEKAHLMPLYVHAQTVAAGSRNKARLEKQRRDVIESAEKAIEKATTERAGFLWLMDHGVSIDNCIYYGHTGRFSFGWRNPVSVEVRDAILAVVSEFPFPYEIKCSDGTTLEGY